MKLGVAFVLVSGLTFGWLVGVVTGQSQWDGVYTAEQAKRGGTLYEEKCSTCHGSDQGGSQMAPPLVGKDFATGWNDLPLTDIFDLIKVTMPQDSPDSLSNAQVADVVAFLLERGGYPVGKSELAGDSAELKKYKFAAAKP